MSDFVRGESMRVGTLSASRTRALTGLSRPRASRAGPPADDRPVRAILHELAGRLPVMGYRKATAHLRADDRLSEAVNAKRVLRLMREEALLTPRPRRFRPRTTDSRHRLPRFPNLARGLAPLAADALWVSDITYIELANGRFVYLALVMDACTRRILGWALDSRMQAALVVDALRQAVQVRGGSRRPETVVHSDQGSQYASAEYRAFLAMNGLKGSMGDRGDCYENAQAERLNGTIKTEEVYKSEYRSLAEARDGIGTYIRDVYNSFRLHQALGYVTPMQFEERLLVERSVA